ncbi:MAG: TatD family hydrolase [Candidatus Aureabacteria bacterium]|nr:TatD family hydrolase [Candidatus Auribacterota bacterium]
MFIDTHAHLTDDAFRADLDQVMERASASGVGAVIDVGDTLESSRAAAARARSHPRVFAAVGIHPNNASRADDGELRGIGKLAAEKGVVGIGETGLDFYRQHAVPERQEEFFRRSMAIAAQCGLPVIIHCRQAYRRLIAILKEQRGPGVGGVIHCFSGSAEDASALLDLGYSISVGGPLTYPGSRGLRETVGGISLDRVLIETDCPYLPPQGKRGERNEPANVVAVAEALAALKKISLEEIAAVTTANARRLFRGINV